jgi:hypothetical protein
VVAELPPRAEKMAPTMPLKTKLTPSATNQPTTTLVQLVPNCALSLTPPPSKQDSPLWLDYADCLELSLASTPPSKQEERKRG